MTKRTATDAQFDNVLQDPSNVAEAAFERGMALLKSLFAQAKDTEHDDPETAGFREAHRLLDLCTRLDPSHEKAKANLAELSGLFKSLPVTDSDEPNHDHALDVVIVGAGAAGVGVALQLVRNFGLDKDRVILVERGQAPGETFRRWPAEMRWISPSLNHQGWTGSFDLNSVAFGTSPSYTLGTEHPSGKDYAQYLCAVSDAAELSVRTNTEVVAVKPQAGHQGGFHVDVQSIEDPTQTETLRARYVIWAAGEFQYPQAPDQKPLFPGAQLCRHNSSVTSWSSMAGDNHIVIGGYESGCDAAFNLANLGKQCTVVSSTACWDVQTNDPSTELSPYTADRIRRACHDDSLHSPKLLAPLRVFGVERAGDGNGFVVRARWCPAAADDRQDEDADEDDLEAEADVDTGSVVFTEDDMPECALPRDADDFNCVVSENADGKMCLVAIKPIKAGGRLAVAPSDDEDSDEEDSDEEDDEDDELPVARHRLSVVPDDARKEPRGEAGTEIELRTPQPPLLCTGFAGSVVLGVAKDLFKFTDEEGCAAGSPKLTDTDQSTETPGLFLVGSLVRHGELSFCFVYKFRQRFGVVADTIARGLGFHTAFAVKQCRDADMFLDDFETCEGACGETC